MLSILTLTTLALQFLFASSLTVKRSGCAVKDSTAMMNLSPTFPTPTAPLSYVAVAIGTQNYTCSAAGTYTNVGAVAELFDISCLASSKTIFDKITDIAVDAWKLAPPNLTPQKIISALSTFKSSAILGQHYYVTNPVTGVGVSPKWDFTASEHREDAWVAAARAFGATATTGSQDIDWVELNAIAGVLASQVYRTDTRLGQPPASCTPGSEPITVKYAAKYWLFGGSIKN